MSSPFSIPPAVLSFVNQSLLYPQQASSPQTLSPHSVTSVATQAIPSSPVLPTAPPTPHPPSFFSAENMPLPEPAPELLVPEHMRPFLLERNRLLQLEGTLQEWIAVMTSRSNFIPTTDPADSSRFCYCFPSEITEHLRTSAEYRVETKIWVFYPKNFPDSFLAEKPLDFEERQNRLLYLKSLLICSPYLLPRELIRDFQGKLYLRHQLTQEILAGLDVEGNLESLQLEPIQRAIGFAKELYLKIAQRTVPFAICAEETNDSKRPESGTSRS